jgi:hypothetical protein
MIIQLANFIEPFSVLATCLTIKSGGGIASGSATAQSHQDVPCGAL